jgi:hypothetical protein
LAAVGYIDSCMTRTQFIIGFGRIRLVFHCLALAVWLGGLVLGVALSIDQAAQDSFPYVPFYDDVFLLTAAFSCLGERILSMAFAAPVALAQFLIGGFVQLDDEGVPPEHWAVFQFVMRMTSLAGYLASVAAWLVAIVVARALAHKVTELLLHHVGLSAHAVMRDVRWFSCAEIILLAILVNLGLKIYMAFTIYPWLERLLVRLVGQDGVEELHAFVRRVAAASAGGWWLLRLVGRN